MKVYLFRSNNIFASRVNKYVHYYKARGIDYTIVGWNRAGEQRKEEHYEFCQYKAQRNVGGIRAVKNHIVWMCFVFRYLNRHRDATTIHACDVNAAFPAAMFKKFVNNKVVLLFDACDWSSDNFARVPFVAGVIRRMEKIAYKYSNRLIICEPERIKQIQFVLREDPLVLPNIPRVDSGLLFERKSEFCFGNDRITFAYFGNFAPDRFIEELLCLAKSGAFNLLIAGYGDMSIENLARSLGDENSNVRYFGKVDMNTGLLMSMHADAVFAFYCLSNLNHKYAAPNKYYEALYLGLPIITNEGTILAEKVKRNNVGYVLSASGDSILSFVNDVTKDQLKQVGKNARSLWDSEFSTYVDRFFREKYDKLLV